MNTQHEPHYPSGFEDLPRGTYHRLIEKYLGKCRRYCADLVSIQYLSGHELVLFAYDARYYRQVYDELLLPDDARSMDTAIELAFHELRRRDEMVSGKTGVVGYVYLLSSPFGYFKIGCSTKPKNRLMTFGVQLPFEVECDCLIFTGDMYGLEHQLHERFMDRRAKGEWFQLTTDDVNYIKGLSQ